MSQRRNFGMLVLMCALLPQMAVAGMGMMYMSSPRNIKGADMAMHHMHIVMNHGMAMVARGANLVMAARMSMSPETDAVDIRYGEKMVDNGKSLIQKMLSGQTMKKLHLSKHEEDALMLYTHELGEAMQAVTQVSEKIVKAEALSKDEDGMTLIHIHLMVNRGLMLSLEGSSLVMFGQMDMVRGPDVVAVKHGRGLMSLARALWQESVQGKGMKTLHGHGADGSASMEYAHRHANAVKKVMDMLDGMGKVKATRTSSRSPYNRY